MQLVIDPPRQSGLYLCQEECCYSRREVWQVPARALHVATMRQAVYIPPLENWQQFCAAVDQYDDVWMMYSFPLQKYLDVPQRVRSKIIAVTTPHRCNGSLIGMGFRDVESAAYYPLNIDESFWPLFTNNEAFVQVNSGCPFSCTYCPWSRGAFPQQQWADPRIVAHLANIAKSPVLLCSQITGNHGWIEIFLGHRDGQADQFVTDLNCAHLPAFEPDIRRLAEAGLRRAVVGTEAFCERSLERLNCPHTIEQTGMMMDLLAELGVEADYQLRYGYGETLEEIEETAHVLLRLAANSQLAGAPHKIVTGPIIYWWSSPLAESVPTRDYVQHGYHALVQSDNPVTSQAWLRCYGALRDAGLNVF